MISAEHRAVYRAASDLTAAIDTIRDLRHDLAGPMPALAERALAGIEADIFRAEAKIATALRLLETSIEHIENGAGEGGLTIPPFSLRGWAS